MFILIITLIIILLFNPLFADEINSSEKLLGPFITIDNKIEYKEPVVFPNGELRAIWFYSDIKAQNLEDAKKEIKEWIKK